MTLGQPRQAAQRHIRYRLGVGAWATVCALAGACGTESPCGASGVAGTERDVTTPLGETPEYEVRRGACGEDPTLVVVGGGFRTLEQGAPSCPTGAPPADSTSCPTVSPSEFRAHVEALLAEKEGVRSDNQHRGVFCDGTFAVVQTDDWGDVDPIIDVLIEAVRAWQLRTPVGVEVSPFVNECY